MLNMYVDKLISTPKAGELLLYNGFPKNPNYGAGVGINLIYTGSVRP